MRPERGVWQYDGHDAVFTIRFGIGMVRVVCPHDAAPGAGVEDLPACLVDADGKPAPECIVHAASVEYADEELWDPDACQEARPCTNPFPVAWRLESSGVYVKPALILRERDAGVLDPDRLLEESGSCPTACDAECEAYCHALHQPRWKRAHEPGEHHPQVAALAHAYTRLVAQHQGTAALLAETGRSRERLAAEVAFERREKEAATGNWHFAAGRYREAKAALDALEAATGGGGGA